MSGYTTGPWEYQYEPGYCGEIVGANGDAVCAFVEEPSEANARLIAAAPDLLGILKRLSDAVGNLDPQSGIPIGYQRLLDVSAEADALIAKAMGEQP